MIGDEGGIFNEALDWKSLFLLKRKINRNLICPNKEYNVIFKYIYQNIMTYWRSQKSALINDMGNTIVYWEEYKQSQVWLTS